MIYFEGLKAVSRWKRLFYFEQILERIIEPASTACGVMRAEQILLRPLFILESLPLEGGGLTCLWQAWG
jgi:hypothetical protein